MLPAQSQSPWASQVRVLLVTTPLWSSVVATVHVPLRLAWLDEAAAALAAIEGTRFNRFVYWREREAKIASTAAKLTAKAVALLRQRRAIGDVITDPPKLPADTAEPVQ